MVAYVGARRLSPEQLDRKGGVGLDAGLVEAPHNSLHKTQAAHRVDEHTTCDPAARGADQRIDNNLAVLIIGDLKVDHMDVLLGAIDVSGKSPDQIKRVGQ